jgi:thiol:disulfide interchange protein
MKSLTLALLLIFSSFCFASDEEVPAKPVLSSIQKYVYKNQNYLAISLRHSPHWHTYWKNPGDAGLPTVVKITGLETAELEWPTPTRYIEEGEILAYGYSGEITRFFKVANLKSGEAKINAHWLVCKHVCIPGKFDQTINISVDGEITNSQNDFNVSPNLLEERIEGLPQLSSWPNNLDLNLKKGKKENRLHLYFSFNNAGGKKPRANLNLLTPFPTRPIDFKHEALYRGKSGDLFGKMPVDWDGEYEEPAVLLPQDGQFQKPIRFQFLFNDPVSEKVFIVEKTFHQFDLEGIDQADKFLSDLTYLPANKSASSKKKIQDGPAMTEGQPPSKANTTDQSPILYYLLMAFIGGLILNIMPCVLPVISLKLFSLVAHSDEKPESILKHNVFYTLGVLFTFFIMATIVTGFKEAGESIGWGFQLQSPRFVGLMVVFLFIFTLNLFGLFEFRTPGGKVLGDVQLKKGMSGDFMSGVLATILSTPCSAPFLGTALTFAFTAPHWSSIYIIFSMVGLGLAFPFLLTGLFPKTISFLPKPGMWMEKVKKFMGLTLILTMIWLLDVFSALVDSSLSVIKMNTALSLFFFAFYFQHSISKSKVWRFLFFALPTLLLINLMGPSMEGNLSSKMSSKMLLQDKNSQGLNWEPWSEARMKELAKEKKSVFLDFTAKWCFTCKVNEKLVIDTDGFKKLVKENNLTLLLGDWTQYDASIGEFLKKNGHVGVPAYFIQKPDGTLIKLGETITLGKIKSNL